MDRTGLNKQITEYCEGRPEIIACYLFGSFATGSNRHGSDLDLAFLLIPEISAAEYGNFKDSIVTGLGRRTRLDIHPLIMNNAGELVLGQIFSKGEIVFSRMPEKLCNFRSIKFPLIAEFSYYIDMMQSHQKKCYGK